MTVTVTVSVFWPMFVSAPGVVELGAYACERVPVSSIELTDFPLSPVVGPSFEVELEPVVPPGTPTALNRDSAVFGLVHTTVL